MVVICVYYSTHTVTSLASPKCSDIMIRFPMEFQMQLCGFTGLSRCVSLSLGTSARGTIIVDLCVCVPAGLLSHIAAAATYLFRSMRDD